MSRFGACPCGAVRFSIDGPVRDVLVCHCGACREAAGGPWAASAAYRSDLVIEDEGALTWERAAVSEHDASRGRCRACGTVLFWDAPSRETVSFGVATLEDDAGIALAAHIWVPKQEREELLATGLRVEPEGLPASISLRWYDETPGRG